MPRLLLSAATDLLLGDVARLLLKLAASLACAGLLLLAMVAAGVVSVVGLLLPLPPLPSSGSPGPGVTAGGGSGAGHPIPAGDGAAVLEVARTQLGMPYVWGGASPLTSFDCSGLVQWSFGRARVRLPRTAQQQFDATPRVAREELRPGDLVFFQICCQPPDVVTHVGIYVGTGQMLHAPAPGEYVRIESIDTPYWRSQWAGAGRVAVSTASSRPPRESTP